MRILITGGEGQLGRALAAVLADAHEVHAPGREALDVRDYSAVCRAVDRVRPEVVVHCAALTDTARCEREPALAERINADGPATVARACAGRNAPAGGCIRVIAIGTNEVFDGAKTTQYDEDDVAAPLNAYGRSKLEGERRALAAGGCVSVVRTSWLYGDSDRSFVAKVLAAARAGRPLRFVTDEVASPTSCDDLARALAALAAQPRADRIYHLVNEGAASRYEWAREILRLAGMDAELVRPVTTVELRESGYDGPAKPPYSALANNRGRALGITLRPWREALVAHFDARPELRGEAPRTMPAHG